VPSPAAVTLVVPPVLPPPLPPAIAREPSPPAGDAGVPKGAAVPKETIDLLVRRGDEMLAAGDISAARLFYERAAATGDARAATAAGKTYDPNFLRQVGAFGVAARPEQAARWYRQAIAAGDAEAGARMARLQALGVR
jgi:TPR repeat protein